ncbi:hypothetical protein JOY44_17125 [Phormidium sp. CLA17]|nr:hypothetical protein [Leptolyngbya sp. Cla-17]MBM0743315.1 hypothetical protein [Leptolyngbya sp. Cla-17]
MNAAKLAELEPTQNIVKLCQWEDTEAEADEMWSFVKSKAQQRSLARALTASGIGPLMGWNANFTPGLKVELPLVEVC